MICNRCGHSQDAGNFCGKCGEKFVENVTIENTETPATNVHQEQSAASDTPERPVYQQPAEANIHVEKLKKQSKMYGSYFMEHSKRPASSFRQSGTDFTNGLISILLFSAIIAASSYLFIKNAAWYGTGFFSVFFSNTIFILIALSLAAVSMFVIARFFGPSLPFTSIISIYGAHITPLLIGAGAAFILLFLKSLGYGSIILSLTFMFALFIMPLYIISTLVTKQSSSIDPLYVYMLYIVLFSIVFFIFLTILVDSSLGQYMDFLRFATFW